MSKTEQHKSSQVDARAFVYIVINEVAESNWGIFGNNADLAALRASSLGATAI